MSDHETRPSVEERFRQNHLAGGLSACEAMVDDLAAEADAAVIFANATRDVGRERRHRGGELSMTEAELRVGTLAAQYSAIQDWVSAVQLLVEAIKQEPRP